jgi:tripartite-type tricarboxylate transporter receptor subunit TctC
MPLLRTLLALALALLLAEKLAAKWGQPVVVENRAGGNLGAGFVAQSSPDGYTVLVSSPGLAWTASRSSSPTPARPRTS